jgi:phosphinothricin acetyltransferase
MTQMAERMLQSAAIRPAEGGDLAILQRIYAWHVRNGSASFEEEPPEAAEFERRWRQVTELRLPYLVAERSGEILGYAYAGPYRPRSAYRFTVEDSIYLDPKAVGQGTGSALLAALIERCTQAGKRQMLAVIGDSANAASVAVHRRHGFRMVGTIEAAGFKFGRWVDTVLMQRPLGAGAQGLP